jgi:hypothetical protein
VRTPPVPNRTMDPRSRHSGRVPSGDITPTIKSWGRRGIIGGALFGLTLGVMLVAIPLTSDILTFGVFGTLMVAAVECAVIAGGFAALAAALFGNNRHKRSEPTTIAERRNADAGWLDIDVPYARESSRRSYPAQTTLLPDPQVADREWSTDSPLQNVQAHLTTIDAWENGNTGP